MKPSARLTELASRPTTSYWLQAIIRSLQEGQRDTVDTLNDLQLLQHILKADFRDQLADPAFASAPELDSARVDTILAQIDIGGRNR